MPPFLAAAMEAFDKAGSDVAFDYGLTLIIGGLEARQNGKV
jgi:hypothetical protein